MQASSSPCCPPRRRRPGGWRRCWLRRCGRGMPTASRATRAAARRPSGRPGRVAGQCASLSSQESATWCWPACTVCPSPCQACALFAVVICQPCQPAYQASSTPWPLPPLQPRFCACRLGQPGAGGATAARFAAACAVRRCGWGVGERGGACLNVGPSSSLGGVSTPCFLRTFPELYTAAADARPELWALPVAAGVGLLPGGLDEGTLPVLHMDVGGLSRPSDEECQRLQVGAHPWITPPSFLTAQLCPATPLGRSKQRSTGASPACSAWAPCPPPRLVVFLLVHRHVAAIPGLGCFFAAAPLPRQSVLLVA